MQAPTAHHPLFGSFQALVGQANAETPAKMIALVSPSSRSGTSYVARALAELGAEQFIAHGRRVLLVDYDINQQTQAAHFEHSVAGSINKKLQGPFDVTFGQTPFWQVSPDTLSDGGQRATESFRCGMYLVGETGLAVTRFDWNSIKQGQTVHVVETREYWKAVREQFALIIVDCPPFDREDTGLNIFHDADQTVIVSLQSKANDPANALLAQTVSDAGGKCAGIILNAGPKALQGQNPSYGQTG